MALFLFSASPGCGKFRSVRRKDETTSRISVEILNFPSSNKFQGTNQTIHQETHFP